MCHEFLHGQEAPRRSGVVARGPAIADWPCPICKQRAWAPQPLPHGRSNDERRRVTGAQPPVLQGERVTLRRPVPQDVEARSRLGVDPEIHRMYGGSRDELRPMTLEGARRWVQRISDHDHAWVIEAQTLIGEVRLDRVDLRDRRAALAIGIEDRGKLGRGLGTDAIRLVLDFAFNEIALHRLSVRVIAYNIRAIRAYEKCGFTVEGREREAAQVDGAWYDDLMMGLLDREYARLTPLDSELS